MAHHRLTGVLLVGGASERFGSPKALALFRGETLAERAWRVLGEACDEVLAVGKTADGLDLPFPVLDDGSPERAPVFGVLAGLRAAAHEAVVFLPVDCPLLTAEALRALGAAVAVPRTGPLPGAYAKSMLPAIEQRVAAGRLTLWGVNAHVLELDERLLADVATRRGSRVFGACRRAKPTVIARRPTSPDPTATSPCPVHGRRPSRSIITAVPPTPSTLTRPPRRKSRPSSA